MSGPPRARGRIDIEDLRAQVLDAALAHVPFEGWTVKALMDGAEGAGLERALALEAFPGGVASALEFAAQRADRAMVEALGNIDLKSMRIRDRIAAAVRARIEPGATQREQIRAALAHLALPQNLPLGAKILWRTVDAIWYAAGDTATDFNFYTKRGLLAAVYSSTLVYWLGDRSKGAVDSWAFLERRIAEVMQVPKAMGRVRAAFEKIPSPFGLARAAAARRQKTR
jgi:ubiquinone biosynthesis protein COQ9